MDRTEAKITDAELEVMGALWSGAGPMTLSQLKDALARSQGWSGDTTKTLLRRLCGKGAVEQEKREVYYYRPLVSREELGDYKTRTLIEKLYDGKAKDLVAALVERRQLDRSDVAELKDLFDRLWEERGEDV